MKLLKRLGMIFSALILCVICLSSCNNEQPSEIEEYLCEVFTPNTVCKRISDGKYFKIYERYSVDSGWMGELISLENIRDIYEGEEYCCRTVAEEYRTGEAVYVDFVNNSDGMACFNTLTFALEYLFEGKWYTIRTGEKPNSLSVNEGIICEAGEIKTFEMDEAALFEFYKNENIDYLLDEDDWDERVTKRYEPTILRPGHYRFLCPVQLFGSDNKLQEELLIACEFDIVE